MYQPKSMIRVERLLHYWHPTTRRRVMGCKNPGSDSNIRTTADTQHHGVVSCHAKIHAQIRAKTQYCSSTNTGTSTSPRCINRNLRSGSNACSTAGTQHHSVVSCHAKIQAQIRTYAPLLTPNITASCRGMQKSGVRFEHTHHC